MGQEAEERGTASGAKGGDTCLPECESGDILGF